MSNQHEFDPWPDKVSFDWKGNPVVQKCLSVVDGQACHRPYSDPVHLAMQTEERGAVIEDGPWKGWREAGVTDQA